MGACSWIQGSRVHCRILVCVWCRKFDHRRARHDIAVVGLLSRRLADVFLPRLASWS